MTIPTAPAHPSIAPGEVRAVSRGGLVSELPEPRARTRKRQRTAALQDADVLSHAPEIAKRLGVRLSSAAFGSAGTVSAMLRHYTRLSDRTHHAH